MANTPSNMIPLQTIAPDFSLFDTVSENILSLNDLKGKSATVIIFICNHCPFVIHINKELVKIANDFTPKGISFIAISSNDIVNYPQDAPKLMQKVAIDLSTLFRTCTMKLKRLPERLMRLVLQTHMFLIRI